MRSLGPLLLSIVIGIVVVVLAFKLLGAALKLVGILIGLGVAIAVYFAARKMLEGPR
jgi:asparagine N-glycosylation enzyme membrane subunit Stt3